jgi:oxygen-independent coproporphyrinogen III oxidase
MMTPAPFSYGLYFHIPFCIQKCRYCDFNKIVRSSCTGAAIKQYHQALLREWEFLREEQHLTSVQTIYFGGGTPSLYPPDKIEVLLTSVFQSVQVSPEMEITLEIDPKTIRKRSLERLQSLGVNRVSLGVQSFQDPLLEILGRYHRQKDILECYEDCRSAGFSNVSFDLIYGIPGQTLSLWEKDLEWLERLKPEHVSLYNLNIARGTDFFRKRKQLTFPEEKTQIAMYYRGLNRLKTIRILPYEISNLSKPGYESRHNLDCWNRKPYLGIGAGASSFSGKKRWSNIRNFYHYIRQVEVHGKGRTRSETLSLQDEKMEFVMLSLRQIKGFNRKTYRELFRSDVEKDFPSLFIKKELNSLIIQGKRIKLSRKGRILSNEIFQELV